jgi:hypothetical protein
MQIVDIRNRYLQISGLHLMRRIKNDPKNYLKRSDLFPKNKGRGDKGSYKNRELEFITAPIDQAGYINFRTPNKPSDKR